MVERATMSEIVDAVKVFGEDGQPITPDIEEKVYDQDEFFAEWQDFCGKPEIMVSAPRSMVQDGLVELKVSTGSVVGKGDTLALLDAGAAVVKAEFAAVVSKLLVQDGDTVKKGGHVLKLTLHDVNPASTRCFTMKVRTLAH